MNYETYRGTVRNNLSYLLSRQVENKKKIIKIRESIEYIIIEKIIKIRESIEYIIIEKQIEQPARAWKTILELKRAIEFFEKLNSDYEIEVMRLTKILLDK